MFAKCKKLPVPELAAQIGYLFLIFPLAKGAAVATAFSGGMFHILSHGFAKASMFMTAGLIAGACGHDRLAELRGVMKSMPVATAAFVLAALSLVGVPPTGGFIAKGQLLSAAVLSSQWPWVIVILLGGLLTGAYMFRALSSCLSPSPHPFQPLAPVSRFREWLVLALACISLLIGMFPGVTARTIEIGRPTPIEAQP